MAAAKKPRTAKPRIAEALAKTLSEALGQPDVPRQVDGLHRALGEMAAARAKTAAAAMLAKTDKGTPVARAYLAVLAADGDGPTPAADTIAQYCATLGRARELVFGAFIATWRRAADITAVDAACRNFQRAYLDDPDLLAASVEAARQLGDADKLAKRTARLDRATRLAPLVADLRGTRAARAKATGKLAKLSDDDRLHVHARVIASPRDFDQPLAVAAVIAMVDDPRVPDMPLSAAIADMRYHGAGDLIAAWRTRTAAGDSALITRLLALFEWTALGATEPEQLTTYIHALHPAGGSADVFGQVENALASDSAVVRAAVCDEWLRDEGVLAFDDTQLDKLLREVVALAEAGGDTADRRAANRALFHASRAGARRALIDGVRNARIDRNDELRWNLYYGLSHVDHADVDTFLVERLFVERDEYGALIGALAEKLDPAIHRRVLDRLAERAGDSDGIHAATAYVDVVVERAPRFLVELARAVLRWKSRTEDDARRLRYLFEHATAAALALKIPVDARAFLARARELPASPYSDFRVKDREEWTPSAFADPVTQQRIAALEAGKLMVEGRDAPEKPKRSGPAMFLVCRNRVTSFARWKRVFDAHRAAHRAAGLTLRQLTRGLDDKNQVFFMFEIESIEKARGFINDPAAAEAGKTAGVLDGEYHFVESV
jgi:hypothetical protein